MEKQTQYVPQGCEFLGSAKHFVDEIQEIFHCAPLLDVLDVSETQLLCNFMACCSAPRGHALLHEGGTSDFMFFLLTGKVELSVRTGAGEKTLAVLGPGAAIGEMAMIDGTPCWHSCVAVEPVDLVLMSRQAFKDVLLTYPRLGNKFLMLLLHSLSERLQHGVMSSGSAGAVD